MPPRIPTLQDFRPILSSHPTTSTNNNNPPITLLPPNPPESTTTFLLLLHGLGDTHHPFSQFARNLNLPGVFSISLRGIAPLPAAFLFGDNGEGYHWGDELLATSDGGIDSRADPGFEKAREWVLQKVIGEVLVKKCGWEVGDVMIFGFGQGGSVALGLASMLRLGVSRVQEVKDGDGASGSGLQQNLVFKGVVSIGGGLPASMVPSVSNRGKAKTPVLVLCGRESEEVDDDAVEVLEREFEKVEVVRWKRASDGMPQNREEALPMMRFFADKLRNVWL
ncbi:hypothetical protein VTJ04DRAFT_6450 [Mycothermus thermophilus]|uniref:uncharacterized protein n=1 Tax=Humicola insolens TaxID=85995 RepID=UPI0037438BD5